MPCLVIEILASIVIVRKGLPVTADTDKKTDFLLESWKRCEISDILSDTLGFVCHVNNHTPRAQLPLSQFWETEGFFIVSLKTFSKGPTYSGWPLPTANRVLTSWIPNFIELIKAVI